MKTYIYRLYLFVRYTIFSKLWPYILYYVTTILVKLRIIVGREPISLSDTDSIKRILIIGPEALGDITLFSSAMRHIREKFQQQTITVLSRIVPQDYLRSCPYVDRVLVYDERKLTVATVLKDIKFFQFLRRERFDLVISALWTQTEIAGFLTYVTGAPIRVGCFYPKPIIARMRTGVLFTHCLTIQEEKSALEYYIDLLGYLDIHPTPTECQPEIWSTAADRHFAMNVTQSALSKSDYIIAIAPGAGVPERQWLTKSYAEVADYCMSRYQATVIILGGPGDIELTSEIVENMVETPINLAGKATFAQAGEILKRSHLFIGNDSGPMHLAAAAGVRVIGLFASRRSLPQYAPYGHGHQIVCDKKLPDFPNQSNSLSQEPFGLAGISPDEVILRIRKILAPQ